MINCKICQNDKGETTNLKVVDSYNRGIESRHNFDLIFRYTMDLFEKELYLPYLEKVKEQKLYNDLMYDEFEKIILGQKLINENI